MKIGHSIRFALVTASLSQFAFLPASSGQEYTLPPARVVPWVASDDPLASTAGKLVVGIPGGFANRNAGRVVVQAPAPSGGDDALPLNNLIKSVSDGTIIELQTGNYKISSVVGMGKDHHRRTLRGKGVGQTVIQCSSSNACLSIAGYIGNAGTQGTLAITGGLQKGSTQLTLSDTAPLDVGDQVELTARNDFALPVISVTGFRGIRYQLATIEAIDRNAKTVTIKPALMMNYASTSLLRYGNVLTPTVGSGFEDFTLDGTSAENNPPIGIVLLGTYGSWVSNVVIKGGIKNYPLELFNNISCEVRQSEFLPTSKEYFTSNGAGILMNTNSACLVEDNIVLKLFPGMELNFTDMGNVIAHNVVLGGALNTNHGPHNSFNLFEGNVTDGFHSDGYFGGESDETIFRNRVLSFIANKRFSRNFNIVGNILHTPSGAADYGNGQIHRFLFRSVLGESLGDASYDWLLSQNHTTLCPEGFPQCAQYPMANLDAISSAVRAGPYQANAAEIITMLERGHPSYNFGRPNIGNLNYQGDVQPSKGRYWKDWDPTSNPTTSGAKVTGTVTGQTGSYVDSDGKTVPYFSVIISDPTNNQRLFSYAQSLCFQFNIKDINNRSTCQSVFGVDWGDPATLVVGNVVAYDVDNSKVYITGVVPPGVVNVGIWPRSEGFQEFDLDVDATTILKANYMVNAQGGGKVYSGEVITGTLPLSMFRSQRPTYWPAGKPWPAFDPITPNIDISAIPAGERYASRGNCGDAANQCDTGTLATPSSTATHYYWSCTPPVAGFATANCSLKKSNKDGKCGTAIYTCEYGAPNAKSTTATSYEWSCQGDEAGANVRCTTVNQPPALQRALTTSVLSAVVAGQSLSISLDSTDERRVSGVKLFVQGSLVPAEQVRLSTPVNDSGTTRWVLNVDWTPNQSGSIALSAKVVDELGAESQAVAVQQMTLNNDPNLINFWMLNDGSGSVVHDSSASKNDGAIITTDGNAPQWGAREDGIKVLLFRGTTKIEANNNIGVYPLTGCVWMSRAGAMNYIDEKLYHTLHFNMAVSANNNTIFGNDKFSMDFYNGISSLRSTGFVPGNVWNHLCLVITADGDATFYNNGEAAGSLHINSNEINYGGGKFIIGNGFNGLMNDLRIYRRALSAQEIRKLILLPVADLTPGGPTNLRVQ